MDQLIGNLSSDSGPISLKALRLNRGLTLQALSDECGVATSVLQRGERGESVSRVNAKRIADFYGVRVTDLWPVEERVA